MYFEEIILTPLQILTAETFRGFLRARSHCAFSSDCDCDSSYHDKCVVQNSMEVFTLCDCDKITNSYAAHYEQEQIAVAIRKKSLCERALRNSAFSRLALIAPFFPHSLFSRLFLALVFSFFAISKCHSHALPWRLFSMETVATTMDSEQNEPIVWRLKMEFLLILYPIPSNNFNDPTLQLSIKYFCK